MKKYLSLALVLVLGLAVFPVAAKADDCADISGALDFDVVWLHGRQDLLGGVIRDIQNETDANRLLELAGEAQSYAGEINALSQEISGYQTFLETFCLPLPQ